MSVVLRLPYKWRRPEGVSSGIPKLRVLHYKLDCLLENIFIRLARLPKSGICNEQRQGETVTVSLTSFPARIHKVYYAIKSLMLQTYQANRIVLWLAEDQFPDKKLPAQLQKLTERGLEIAWCDNLYSHKKYHYALQQQKENELVITYDDDLIYEADSIEKLITAHRKFPHCIVCNRAHYMPRNNAGQLLAYTQWRVHSPYGVQRPEMDLLPSTGNGCLYPYGCMPDVTFDWDIARQTALTADDLWMRFCSICANIPVVKTRQTIAILCNIWGSQKQPLTKTNDLGGENQRTIERICEQFPAAREFILGKHLLSDHSES